MKLKSTEIVGLFNKPATPQRSGARPALCNTSQLSGREIARVNEFKVMAAVAHFGHLRIIEISRCVWPLARYGEQVCRRVVARLTLQGLLLERRNALGSKSLCLTRGGAAWLDARGVEAQHTLDLTSVSGATFFHRTLATRYLIERQIAGQHVAGEYQLLRRKLPFSIEALTRTLRKLPDGFCWNRMADGTIGVELVEQEAAAKARAELEKCLKAAELHGQRLDASGKYRITGLVFVFDRELNHAKRIAQAENSLWSDKTNDERVSLERRVKLVSVELRDPLLWVSAKVTTLHDMRQRGI